MTADRAERIVIPLPTGRPTAGGRPGPGDRLARRTGDRPARRPVIPAPDELSAAADPLSVRAAVIGSTDANSAAGAKRKTSSEDGSPHGEKPHGGKPAGDTTAAGDGPAAGGEDWLERAVSGVFSFAKRRLSGDYAVDDFGFDRDLTENVFAAAMRPMYEKWFRVEVRGLENVPSDGAALLVGNHAGNLAALDSLMIMMALLDHHPAHRNLRLLAADLVFSTPLLGSMARKAGGTVACTEDAERLLAGGELVGVWPEGFKGIGKPFSERYKLQRFGRGGFVSAALHARAPIVPVSVVGSEEIYPKIGESKVLARLFGLPYFPITPTFPWLGPAGLVPLPSKWLIEFGKPIPTADLAGAGDDPMLLMNLSDQVRETIQQTLYQLLLERHSVFG